MAAVKKKKRRRKKRKGGHYKTGLHTSPKCLNSPMQYRSGWELVAARCFDEDPKVLHYEYETLKIPYLANKKTRKFRNYIPDFLVSYTDGRKVLIEVKRQSAVTNLPVIKKSAAAHLWAKQNGYEFKLWTEAIILPLKKAQELKEKCQQATTKSPSV